MISRLHTLLVVALMLASTAHIGESFAQEAAVAPARGQLLENPPQQLGFYSPSDLISGITDGTLSRWLLRGLFSPQCSVVVYQVRYGTVGGQGEPNYAGYDTSTLGYHPFMNADQQSADMMDALTAARAALPATNFADNQKLFITGYSEGGYVAMATHRALQSAGIPVTASAPMSGPYALSAFADAMFFGQVGRGAVEEILMLTSSYQHAYGNIYASPTDVFEGRYAFADTLLPGVTGTGTLVAQGLIPESAVFSSAPPVPEMAWVTPATAPSKLASVFAHGFGPDNLITNAYRLSYVQDALTAPDGGYPNTTTGLPPDNPANSLRQALKKNDLRNWVPASPMFLCAGDEDPVVFFMNTQLMQGYWAVTAPESPVTVLNVDAPPSHDGPYKHIRKGFARTKSLLKLIEGRSTVAEEYHDVLVPTFCLQATKSFFGGF